MKRPFDPETDALEEHRAKVLGLGLHSARKSYYPALRARLSVPPSAANRSSAPHMTA